MLTITPPMMITMTMMMLAQCVCKWAKAVVQQCASVVAVKQPCLRTHFGEPNNNPQLFNEQVVEASEYLVVCVFTLTAWQCCTRAALCQSSNSYGKARGCGCVGVYFKLMT